jgi:putative ABC transport system permease protein
MKKLAHSLTIAFDALRINKLRSALTMLGIVIGVAAVIAMVAVGSGAEERIRQQIASIGSNVIVVLSGSLTSSGLRMGTGNAQTLTEEDARAMVRECDGVALATPVVRGGIQAVYGNSNWGTQVMGTTPDYLPIRDVEIEAGQPFTNADVEASARVALLGKTVIDNLFYGEDPVGRVIRIKTVSFTVIGTRSSKPPHVSTAMTAVPNKVASMKRRIRSLPRRAGTASR